MEYKVIILIYIFVRVNSYTLKEIYEENGTKIYIGNDVAALDLNLLLFHNITSVLNVAFDFGYYL